MYNLLGLPLTQKAHEVKIENDVAYMSK